MTQLAINERQTELTKRETETIFWLANSKSKPEIAAILGISTNTIKTHVLHIQQKWNCYGTTAGLVAAAFCKQVITPLAIVISIYGGLFTDQPLRRPSRPGVRTQRQVRRQA